MIKLKEKIRVRSTKHLRYIINELEEEGYTGCDQTSLYHAKFQTFDLGLTLQLLTDMTVDTCISPLTTITGKLVELAHPEYIIESPYLNRETQQIPYTDFLKVTFPEYRSKFKTFGLDNTAILSTEELGLLQSLPKL